MLSSISQGPLWDEHLEAQSTPEAGPARADRLDPLAAVLDRVFPQYIQLIKLKGLPHEQVRVPLSEQLE